MSKKKQKLWFFQNVTRCIQRDLNPRGRLCPVGLKPNALDHSAIDAVVQISQIFGYYSLVCFDLFVRSCDTTPPSLKTHSLSSFVVLGPRGCLRHSGLARCRVQTDDLRRCKTILLPPARFSNRYWTRLNCSFDKANTQDHIDYISSELSSSLPVVVGVAS
jgi:hypothetical protein